MEKKKKRRKKIVVEQPLYPPSDTIAPCHMYPPPPHYYRQDSSRDGLRKAGAILSLVNGGFSILVSIIYGVLLFYIFFNETPDSSPPSVVLTVILIFLLLFFTCGLVNIYVGITVWKRRFWKRCLILSIIVAVLTMGQILALLAAIFIGISKKSFQEYSSRNDYNDYAAHLNYYQQMQRKRSN